MVQIQVNDELREIEAGTTVLKLLRQLELRTRGLAIEVNLEIVPQSEYDQRVLEEGDSLEIVSLVGGG